MTAEGETPLRAQVLRHGHAALQGQGFALVIVLVLVDIPVPLRVIIIGNGDFGLGLIERQRVLDIIRLHIVRTVLVENLRSPVRHPHFLVERHFVKTLGAAVEHHQLRGLHFVKAQLTHVLVVHQERGGIHEQHLLRHNPVRRQAGKQGLEHPHAIVLHQNPVEPILALQFLQCHTRQIRLVIDVFHENVFRTCECADIVFRLALFADQQQRRHLRIEVRAVQCILNKSSFTAAQESGKKIYRQFSGLTIFQSYCHNFPLLL